MSQPLIGVSTNLVGRWARGLIRRMNPKYVGPDGDWGSYTKGQLKTLTEEQMTKYIWDKGNHEIVAVTTEGTGMYAELVFWTLVDGRPKILEGTVTVMPKDWFPTQERL